MVGVAGAQDPSVTEEPQPAGDVAANETAEPEPVSDVTPECAVSGMNSQCTEFGTIRMDARRDIRGDPIDVTVQIELNTAYSDRGARWLMFSVRNVTTEGPSPVTIGLVKFSTSFGDIVTTRVEQPKPSELNLWVDALDQPIATPISLEVRIGATERGAFSLETLVLAFDRGYAPVQDDQGNDASLFSFTVLGVNKETPVTAAGDGSLLSKGNKLPALAALPAVGVLAVAAWILRRRTA